MDHIACLELAIPCILLNFLGFQPDEMFTTPTIGEGELAEGRVKMLITIVETRGFVFQVTS